VFTNVISVGRIVCLRMEYAFEFGADGPQDLTITLAGVASSSGMEALVRDLTSEPRFRGGLTILVDLSALNTSGLSAEEMRAMADSVSGRDWEFPAAAIALVAPSARTFDDAMLYRAHVGGSKSGREVFRSREEALAWLRERRLERWPIREG
jgi:hypothetical protein